MLVACRLARLSALEAQRRHSGTCGDSQPRVQVNLPEVGGLLSAPRQRGSGSQAATRSSGTEGKHDGDVK